MDARKYAVTSVAVILGGTILLMGVLAPDAISLEGIMLAIMLALVAAFLGGIYEELKYRNKELR